MKDKIIEKQDELLTLYESYIQTMNDASKLATIHDTELAQEVWHDAIEMRAKILLNSSELAELKAQDKEVTDEDIKEMIPYPMPISHRQSNINIGWIRGAKAMHDGKIKPDK